MAKRTYSVDMRTFELVIRGPAAGGESSWTVASVTEPSRDGLPITIPGMSDLAASTEDLVLARACDCIDKWLMSRTDGRSATGVPR